MKRLPCAGLWRDLGTTVSAARAGTQAGAAAGRCCPLKEVMVSRLGKGIKLEIVLIPAGESSPTGLAPGVRTNSPLREAAAPRADHQALLHGQVSGDAGAVGGGNGQQPEPLQGSEEPGGNGQLGRLPAVSRQAQREVRRWGRKVPVADRGAVGIRLPGGEQDEVLLWG